MISLFFLAKKRYVQPYMTQQLSRAAVMKLLEMKEEIMHKMDMVTAGEDLTEAQRLINLSKDLFVCLDDNNMLVHIRRYWYSGYQKKYQPHKSMY